MKITMKIKKFFAESEKAETAATFLTPGWMSWEAKNERLNVRLDVLEKSVPAGFREGKCLWCGHRRPQKGERFCLLCGMELANMPDSGFDLVLSSVKAAAKSA